MNKRLGKSRGMAEGKPGLDGQRHNGSAPSQSIARSRCGALCQSGQGTPVGGSAALKGPPQLAAARSAGKVERSRRQLSPAPRPSPSFWRQSASPPPPGPLRRPSSTTRQRACRAFLCSRAPAGLARARRGQTDQRGRVAWQTTFGETV
jgi:hypothetical protein